MTPKKPAQHLLLIEYGKFRADAVGRPAIFALVGLLVLIGVMISAHLL